MNKDMYENIVENAKCAAKKAERGLKKNIRCMKEKDIEIKLKCTEYDVLVFLLGTAIAFSLIHMVSCMRKNAKIKKTIMQKLEKAGSSASGKPAKSN